MMTDLEICKRIAEIEHGSAYIDGDDTGNFINLNHPMSDRGGEMYNPLTDKALCFDLMVKYKASVFHEYDYAAVVCCDSGEAVGGVTLTESPNKAICLAIIEAHKG